MVPATVDSYAVTPMTPDDKQASWTSYLGPWGVWWDVYQSYIRALLNRSWYGL